MAAGQAMVVLVKIRIPAAFQEIEDIDAKHMGLIAERDELAAEGVSEKRRQKQLQQSDGNEFRAVQAEMKKDKAQQAKDQVLFKPPKTKKRELPSFLKLPADKRRREAQATGADDLERDLVADAPAGDDAAAPQAAAEATAASDEGAAEPAAPPSPATDSEDDSSAAEDPPAPAAPEEEAEEAEAEAAPELCGGRDAAGLGLGGYDSEEESSAAADPPAEQLSDG